jgi:DNA invertase Pin-like site-specific DNA recombinase
MTAYGYIRKSVVHDPARMLSPEMQEAAIRKLAAANGDEDVEILSDLDMSGKKRRESRPGWNELLHAVEDGEATAVYAYSLSRFARSVAQLAEFFDLCDRMKVRVRVDRDQIDTSTATGKLVGNVLASLAQFEADVASERVKDAFATKRVRDPEWQGPGNRPYGEGVGEDVAAVVAAFAEAGSFDGAARLLNERRVPSRYNGSLWFGSVVATIMRRVAPDDVLPAVRRGAPAGSHAFRLSRLLACGTCGTFLTPSKDAKYDYIRYYCHRSRVVAHPRKWVTESVVLPGVAAEAERAALIMKRLQKGSRDDEAKMASLSKERERVKTMFRKGHMEEPEFDAAMIEIAEAESKLSTRRWVRRVTIPPQIMDAVDDDGAVVKGDEPGKVNAHLRRLFVRVVVDMSEPGRKGPSRSVPKMRFEWRDPTMRVELDPDVPGPGDVVVPDIEVVQIVARPKSPRP